MDRYFTRLLTPLIIALVFFTTSAVAQPPLDYKLADCLKRAEQSPDITLAEADHWLKSGGGDAARLCRAFAQFHRGEFLLAAQQFQALAESGQKKHRAALEAQAALAYGRANDFKQAEAAYAQALKLEPQDPEVWLDRATLRADNEKYWDSLDDLNRALTLMPDMIEALRLRGQIYTKLGNESNARADFTRAAMLEQVDLGN